MTPAAPPSPIAEKLIEAFGARRQRNPLYTLRAFARDLGMSSGRLSNVLKGRQGLSVEWAQKIAKHLGYSTPETEQFCLLVEANWGRSKLSKVSAHAKLTELTTKSEKQALDHEAFKIIADWYHFAILELTHTESFSSDSRAIAKRLGLSVPEVTLAITRLRKLGLLTLKNGALKNTQNVFANPTGTPSAAMRSFHEQMISKAARSVHEQTVAERDLSSLTLAFNPEDLDEARAFIRNFRKQFDQKFGSGPKRRDVYALTMQFFRLEEKPVTKGEAHGKKQTLGR